MRVFISWSGELSRKTAELLRDWLPDVIQTVEPFVSSEDIEKGTRGLHRIADELQDADFGVICITKSNWASPWINFEAGALSKSVLESRVTPFLVDLEGTDLKQSPLAQFQYASYNEKDVYSIVESINKSTEKPLTNEKLESAFGRCWQELQKKLDLILDGFVPEGEKVSDSQELSLLKEAVEYTRAHQRELNRTQKMLESGIRYLDNLHILEPYNKNQEDPIWNKDSFAVVVPIGPHDRNGALLVSSVSATSSNVFPSTNRITYAIDRSGRHTSENGGPSIQTPEGFEINQNSGKIYWPYKNIPSEEVSFVVIISATNSGIPIRSAFVYFYISVSPESTLELVDYTGL